MLFSRDEWAQLRESTPLTLDEAELSAIRGLNDPISLADVVEIYLPLTRLLNLQFVALKDLRQVTARFLNRPAAPAPFVIGVAGSVAVGKSTVSRLLRALLSRWPEHPRVDLVTTDGFLFPNAELDRRGLMTRKGFPESYDRRALIRFLRALRSGAPEVHAPVYSHLVYDVVAGESIAVRQPDILIVEGLNVLQRPDAGRADAERLDGERVFVADFFDTSVYIDAAEDDIARWYTERFFALRETAFRDPSSYFRKFTALSDDEALRFSKEIWATINGPNLRENIAPTKEHAQVVLEKGPDHRVVSVRLR